MSADPDVAVDVVAAVDVAVELAASAAAPGADSCGRGVVAVAAVAAVVVVVVVVVVGGGAGVAVVMVAAAAAVSGAGVASGTNVVCGATAGAAVVVVITAWAGIGVSVVNIVAAGTGAGAGVGAGAGAGVGTDARATELDRAVGDATRTRLLAGPCSLVSVAFLVLDGDTALGLGLDWETDPDSAGLPLDAGGERGGGFGAPSAKVFGLLCWNKASCCRHHFSSPQSFLFIKNATHTHATSNGSKRMRRKQVLDV